MSSGRTVLIVVENNGIPYDTRVWAEATALRDANWRPIVICPAVKGQKATGLADDPEDMEGIPVYRFASQPANLGVGDYLREYSGAFISITRLCWLVWRKEHFNIIQFCNPPDIFFPIALFYRLQGCGVVFDHHDLFPELILGRFHGIKGSLFYMIARMMEYMTFRSANVVISTNNSYRQIALNRGGMAPNHIFVVRNGPKRSQFLPVAPVSKLKKGFPYLVCYAGVMGREDGIAELVEAIRHIVCDMGRRDIRFVLLGDGAVHADTLAKLQEWGLNFIVEMPGMIRDKLLLRQYLSTADVCVSPEPLTPLNAVSTFIKIGEYMMMGKPVVAFDLSETRYTAQEAALYVEPGNITGFGQSIVDLIDDPEHRQMMGQVAQQRMMQLDWEHQQTNLFNAYQCALGIGEQKG